MGSRGQILYRPPPVRRETGCRRGLRLRRGNQSAVVDQHDGARSRRRRRRVLVFGERNETVSRLGETEDLLNSIVLSFFLPGF